MSQSTSSEAYQVTFGSKGPKWKRTALILGEQVFLPARIFFRSEAEACIVAGCDGESVMHFMGHNYLTAAFFLKEFPEHASEIASVVSRILAAKQEKDNTQ